VLGQFADEAAGDDDRYLGASDDELVGGATRGRTYASELADRRADAGLVGGVVPG
jgi:hypothetical protein